RIRALGGLPFGDLAGLPVLANLDVVTVDDRNSGAMPWLHRHHHARGHARSRSASLILRISSLSRGLRNEEQDADYANPRDRSQGSHPCWREPASGLIKSAKRTLTSPQVEIAFICLDEIGPAEVACDGFTRAMALRDGRQITERRNRQGPWCREGESNPQGPKPGGF